MLSEKAINENTKAIVLVHCLGFNGINEKIIELYEILKNEKKLNNLTNVIYINDLDDYIDTSNNNIIIKEVNSDKIINQMYVKTINNNLNAYRSNKIKK
jgi:hypothetical protein